MNQGPAKSAKFFLGQQFRKQLYRPDIIDQVFKTGAVVAAIQGANAQQPRQVETVDLRQSRQIEELEPPQVRIVSPANLALLASPQVKIRAAVQSRNSLPIQEVKFLLNGRPLFPQPEIAMAASGEVLEIEQNLQLRPGRHEIAVVASNKASTSQPQMISLNYSTEQQASIKPNLYVLAYGISQYADSRHNLNFAHRDAQEFAAAMQRQQGHLYQSVQTRLLTDAEASRKNIVEGMDWLVRSMTQQDVAMFFVSAHGFYDNRRNFYLATHEVDLDALRSTGIAFFEVNRLIQDLPCKVLLFVDTCHSGGVTGAKGKGSFEDPLHDLVAAEVGAIVFASSTPREESLERAEWGHGAFTKALLDSLLDPASDKDDQPDGLLSVTELEFNVARRVKALTGGLQHPVTQKPPTVRDFPVLRILP